MIEDVARDRQAKVRIYTKRALSLQPCQDEEIWEDRPARLATKKRKRQESKKKQISPSIERAKRHAQVSACFFFYC